MIEIPFVKLDPRAQVPRNAYGNDAGWDLFTLEEENVVWSPSSPVTSIRTGIAVSIPVGFFGRIVHRSSTPRNRKIEVVEGTIDAGYTGELLVAVMNLVEYPPTIEAGASIAQFIIQPVPEVVFREYEGLPDSMRGNRGFGSSG